jgi:hypothetical protein
MRLDARNALGRSRLPIKILVNGWTDRCRAVELFNSLHGPSHWDLLDKIAKPSDVSPELL